MTNGDLIVGEVTSLDVYPAIKVKANKVLMKDGKPQGLTGHGYKFKLLGKAADSAGEPYWNTDGSFNANGCEATSEVTVNESGRSSLIRLRTTSRAITTSTLLKSLSMRKARPLIRPFTKYI